MPRSPRRPRARVSALLVLLCAALIGPAGCVALPPPAHGITQISTYPALEHGLYDGDVTYGELAQAGNFGIGTFDGMDGEMIALEGSFYQARSDGTVLLAGNDLETPFATVTSFVAEQRRAVSSLTSYDSLKALLAQAAPPTNRPYAIKLSGRFSRVKIRSIPRQTEPFPPLADVIAAQVTWDKDDIPGTLVGYWFPENLAGINAPGYHLHFISDDRRVAGHLLECSLESGVLEIDYQDQLTVRFPQTPAYRSADFSAAAGATAQNAPGTPPPAR